MSKKETIVWFGMKVSPEEKNQIKKLAVLQGTNQKEAVLRAVEEKIASYEIQSFGLESNTANDRTEPVDNRSNIESISSRMFQCIAQIY